MGIAQHFLIFTFKPQELAVRCVWWDDIYVNSLWYQTHWVLLCKWEATIFLFIEVILFILLKCYCLDKQHNRYSKCSVCIIMTKISKIILNILFEINKHQFIFSLQKMCYSLALVENYSFHSLTWRIFPYQCLFWEFIQFEMWAWFKKARAFLSFWWAYVFASGVQCCLV